MNLSAAAPSASANPSAHLRALAAQALQTARIAAAFGSDAVEAVVETGSTNADLLALARREQPDAPRLRAALIQHQGRGRRGRRWHAAPGAALLFSVSLPIAAAAKDIGGVTLACGIAAAETLRARGVAAALKWPNDVLLDGRKLGGVLCELALDPAGRRTLIAGVGLNLWLDAATRASIGQPAAALSDALSLESLLGEREALIGAIAAAIVEALRLFQSSGFVPLQARFMKLFAHQNQHIDIIDQGGVAGSGRALGVDGLGRLLLDDGSGVQAISAGEVSVRALGAAA